MLKLTNAFSRSWTITKLSFEVMMADKELFLFPLFGGIFSILFLIALIFPAIILSATPLAGLMMFVFIVTIYFGLAFIATFFNVCTVYTIKKRFEGGNATFGESISYALSKLHLVLAWSAILATVGLIFRILEEMADRLGGIGELVARVIISILGVGWAIISSFVIPGMIYHNVGPVKALHNSVKVVKHTWGESLVKFYGLGIIQFVMLLTGGIVFLVLIILSIPVPVLMWIFIVLAILYFLAVMLFFSVANQVFNTALYYYAEKGKIPHGFNSEVIKHAYGKKGE